LGRGLNKYNMRKDPLVKVVEKDWNLRKKAGKNMRDKVARFARRHEASAVEEIIFYARSKKALVKAKKIDTFGIRIEPGPPYTGKPIGDCTICGQKNIKHGERIRTTVNGKLADRGAVGDLIGKDCKKHAVYIFSGIDQPGFKMYQQERDERVTQNFAKATMRLEDLPNKITKQLERQGFDLRSKIASEASRSIQKQVLRGDFASVKKAIDQGQYRGLVGWALSQKSIYHPDVYHTVNMLEHCPQYIKDEQWLGLVLYSWQERGRNVQGELGGIREEIMHLAELSKKGSHPVIKEYGKVDLETVLEPIKIFNKARWEDVELGQFVDDDNSKKLDTITQAQSLSVMRSVPYLRERRETHNRMIMNSYCTPEEFNRLLENLRVRYEGKDGLGGAKKKFAKAKAAGIKHPETSWNIGTHCTIRDFCNGASEARSQNNITVREYALNFTYMHEAEDKIKELFIEGRKCDLADKVGEHVLKESYTTVQDAAERIKKFPENLDKLLNGAVEFDEDDEKSGKRLRNTPTWLKQRFKTTRAPT